MSRNDKDHDCCWLCTSSPAFPRVPHTPMPISHPTLTVTRSKLLLLETSPPLNHDAAFVLSPTRWLGPLFVPASPTPLFRSASVGWLSYLDSSHVRLPYISACWPAGLPIRSSVARNHAGTYICLCEYMSMWYDNTLYTSRACSSRCGRLFLLAAVLAEVTIEERTWLRVHRQAHQQMQPLTDHMYAAVGKSSHAFCRFTKVLPASTL